MSQFEYVLDFSMTSFNNTHAGGPAGAGGGAGGAGVTAAPTAPGGPAPPAAPARPPRPPPPPPPPRGSIEILTPLDAPSSPTDFISRLVVSLFCSDWHT